MLLKLRMTAKRFEQIADDLGPCELVRGEVVYLSPGGMVHSSLTTRMVLLLGNWAERTRRGRVFTNEAGIITERKPDTVRGMDVTYFSYKRLPRDQTPDGVSTVPPELAVEIIGKKQGWKVMVQKAGEYLRMGTDRVWLANQDRGDL